MPSKPMRLTKEQRATIPCCPFCGRHLRPLTSTVSRLCHEPLPTVGETLEIWKRPRTIVQTSAAWSDPDHFSAAYRQHHVVVWWGDWVRRYGEFDRLQCALDFARAAYRAGYRITKQSTGRV